MAKLLTIKESLMNEVLNKLVPSWVGCFDEGTVNKAQVTKSASRNYMFGTILNTKFIKLSKPVAGFKVGTVVSLVDIYEQESASNIAGLIIYRLGHSGLTKQPTIVEA